MLPRKYIHPTLYAISDYCTTAIAWAGFYFIRKAILSEPYTVNYRFWLGVVLVPAGWLVLYALIGSYSSVYKKSRLTEFTNTFICSTIGCVVLFFVFLLDDAHNNYNYYYAAFS